MKRLLIGLVLLAGQLCAQRGTYTVERKSALVGAAEVITVQLPTAALATSVQLLDAAIYCSVECEITLERNGTAATTTEITPTALRSTDSAVSAKAYRSSDVGTGTVVSRYIIPAGSTLALDLSDLALLRKATPENFTIRTASITGTAVIVMKWREY